MSDGTLRGALPVTGSVQAIGADGRTLYVWTSGAINAVDLEALR